jgi:hypothetical protein
VFAVVVCLVAANFLFAVQGPSLSDEPSLTDEQEQDFLLKARVVRSKQIGKGITNPWRLTLNEGTPGENQAAPYQ